MAPSRVSASDRERERQRYKAKLAKALLDEEDPLAVYYQFVEWTLKQYGEKDPKSGLAQLLEEATRVFKDDDVYKKDLRYLKLWSLYSRQVSRTDAIAIYDSLISNNIGTSYSMLYEEYATLLEKDGRIQEADIVYTKGISRNARPQERLKSRYREFQKRSTLSPSSSSSAAPIASSSTAKPQRTVPITHTSVSSTPQSRYALMLAPPPPGKRPEKLRFNLSLLFTEEGVEYSIQEARARSMGLLGKKWASLPITNASQPLSMSVGRDDVSTDVQKSTRFGAASRRKSLYGGGAEPTVTINTKEALADVFGMYNSPDKTRSIGLPGSKHAPLKKVEPITPVAAPRYTSPNGNSNNENINRDRSENDPPQNTKTPTATFRPFVDENAKVNHVSPTSGKFTPFADPDSNKTPSMASSRPILSLKEISLSSNSKSSDSLSPAETYTATTPSETVFSRVFTPAGHGQIPPLAPLREVFTDDHGKPQPKSKFPTHERAQSHGAIGFPPAALEGAPAQSSSRKPGAFKPLADGENARTPFKVFSRPPEQDQPQASGHELQVGTDPRMPSLGRENPFTPKSSVTTSIPFSDAKPAALTPFRDEDKASSSSTAAATPAFRPFVDPGDKENAPAASSAVFAKPRPVLKEAQPRAILAPSVGWPSSGVSSSSSSSFSDLAEIPEQAGMPVRYDEEYYEDEDDEEPDDLDRAQAIMQRHAIEEESEYEYEGESFQDAHHHHRYQDQGNIPLGGRFGKINVMTPITERTLEYTMSTRGGTPSDHLRHGGGGDYEVGGDEEDGDLDMREIIAHQQRSELDALRAAERLAAELKEEDEDEDAEYQQRRLFDPSVLEVEERTGGFSLADTLTLSSNFKPPNPCNPFDPTILSTLLSRIPPDPHFYDLRDQDSGMLDALEKFTKKAAGRKSGADFSCFSLTLNEQRFSVSEKLGEGGFGSVFKGRDFGVRSSNADDGDDDDDLEDDDDESGSSYVALKVVRPRNLWEYHILRRLHSALPPVARRSVILPHALYAFKDESFLALDLCSQGTLLTTVNNAVSAGVSQQGGCLDELLVMFFSIELLRFVEVLHGVGFIHGDLKIDNCLLRLEDVPGGASAWSSVYQPSGEGGWACKGLRIIDFGRAIDARLFPSGQQYLAEWETDERDCFEVRENRPWTYQTDYFGLAGIVYCMLFGKYIQTSSISAVTSNDGVSAGPRYKIGTPLKRYWQADLWNRLFDVLLNPCLVRPDGSLPLCDELADIRKQIEKWLQANCNRSSNTLKGLLKKVEMASLR
ncbi:hypothetical protein AX15_004596 [Amanita polypyramis BW_CC]|nr:hypothetical protein AX15_004596 [Amanita polypyramis BW_CC]